MISKTGKGKGFRGLVDYLMGDGRGVIIAGTMAGTTPRSLAREAAELRKLRPTLGRAVAHFSVSASPDDPPLSFDAWRDIATGFACHMGFEDCAWVAIQHTDTNHPHIHIAALRITTLGEVVNESNDYKKAEAFMRTVEKDYGLAAVEDSASVQRKRRSTSSNPAPSHPSSTNRADASGARKQQSKRSNPHHTNHQEEDMTKTTPHAVDTPQAGPGPDDEAPAAIKAPTAAAFATPGEDPTQKPQAATANILAPACFNPEPFTVRQERNARRIVNEPGYDERVREVFGNQVRNIHHRKGSGAVIYFKDDSRLDDTGVKVTAFNMNHQVAAQRMILLARSRGWPSIQFTGPADFQRIALREAVLSGMPISTDSPSQAAMLQAIRDELAADSAVVGASCKPGPVVAAATTSLSEPEPEPLPLTPNLDVAAKLEMRRLRLRQIEDSQSDTPAPRRPKF